MKPAQPSFPHTRRYVIAAVVESGTWLDRARAERDRDIAKEVAEMRAKEARETSEPRKWWEAA